MAMNDRLKLINKMRKELAKAIGAKIKDVELERDDGEVAEFTVDGEGEYSMTETYEDAEQIALDRVREDLDDEPSLFNQEWLQGFMTVSDTDRRIIAGEETDNRLSDMEDEELIKQADLEEEWESIIEQEDELDIDDPRYEEKEKDIQNKKDKLLNEARDVVEEEIYDEWYNGLEDPVQFLVEEQGFYSREDLLKQPFIIIDREKAAEDAVDTDGAGHFLSSYDGELNETESGFAYWRTN